MRTVFRLPLPFGHPVLTAVLAAAIAFAPGALAGPTGNWERLSPPAPVGGTAVYAAPHERTYVFGGDGTNILHAVPVGDPPVQWENVATAGTPPPALEGTSLSYDPAQDRLIVFGGKDAAGHSHNQVWQLALGGTPTWSLVTAFGAAPAPRSYFGACYNESRGTLFVFGGKDSVGVLLPNKTYQIDLSQPSPGWTQWSPSGDTPSARSGTSLCNDPSHDRMLLFGGTDGNTAMNDVYTMSYGSHVWTMFNVTGDVPPGTSQQLGLYDPDDEMLLVWGGFGSDDDVRSFSPATSTWTIEPNTNWQASPIGHARPVGAWITGANRFLALDGDGGNELFVFTYHPSSASYWQNWAEPGLLEDIHHGATFVYDRPDDQAVLYGGDNVYEQPVYSTWSYAFGAPQGWVNKWFWVNADGPTPALVRHAAVYDDANHRMLVFGGMNAAFARQNAVYADQDSTWGNYWYQLAPTGTPPTARYGTAAIYDPVGRRMLVFGGSDVSGYPRSDLWQLSLTGTPAWTQLVVPGGPSAREDHTAIYDAVHRRMIVFGGTDSIGSVSDNDVWALNLPALTWTHLLPSGTPPVGHAQHTAIYDSRRCRMIVYGGGVPYPADAREVWELDLLPATPVWTKLTPGVGATGQPVTRFQHAAVYDSTGDRMIVFGGLMPPFTIFGNDYPLKDLWSLQFDFSGGVAGVEPRPGVAEFSVAAPSPNPAHGATRLAYSLPHAAHVVAAVYDLAGRRVVTLEDGDMAAGPHELLWAARDGQGRAATPGLYFYRVEAAGRSLTRKVMLVK